MALKATPETGELRLTATVPFVDKATPRTRATRVSRVDEDHGHPCPCGFVHDELTQLPEAPTVLLVALAFANRHPAADVGQLFQHQCSLRVFGIRDQLFRDCMIHPAAKAPFLPAQLFQPAFGGFRASTLVGLAGCGTALAHGFNRLACRGMGIRVHG
jgi:hypothetical protein